MANPAVSGLSISNVAGGASGSTGGTSATLTLASSGVVGANAALAVRVLAAAHAGDTNLTTGKISVLQGADTAPTFGGASVPNQFFRRGAAIAPFQIPAATGGNGTIGYYSSTQTQPNRSLPAGLKFDATGTDAGGCTSADFPPGTAATWATAPRTICGTPTSGALTRLVHIGAFDADSNRAFSDEGSLLVTITIFTAEIASTTPSTLTEGSLHGATVQVQLAGTNFASGVTAASFELVTAIPDVSIGGDALRIDLAERFAAAAGEALSCAAQSSNPSAIRARIEGGTLILEAVGEGTATVTVTAAAADGLTATLGFEARAERTARSRWRLILLEPAGGGG